MIPNAQVREPVPSWKRRFGQRTIDAVVLIQREPALLKKQLGCPAVLSRRAHAAD